MQLKKLELHGFKSFGNKTEIVFEPGITGIVGPNGCGKSNIVDAVKWVLGTLSYKSLRGDEMMDVIFKGAEGVAPKGMAEVTLTLLNDDKQISLDYEEVTITRRLFSSGESEYLINKSTCRLKDIRDLLYGTGIGVDDYSIIEQGKIDKLILSSPRERRTVFDEASGISRYKAKKKESESKLEKVHYDLLRLGDIVREVERETRSIKIQAGRASRYRQLQDEINQKQLTLLRYQLRDFTSAQKKLQAGIAEEGTKKTTLEQEMESLRADISKDTEELREIDRNLQQTQTELVTLESQVLSIQDILQRGDIRQEELKIERESASAESIAVAQKRDALGAEQKEIERVMEELAAEVARVRGQLRESAEKVAQAVNECATLQRELENDKGEVIELLQKGAGYKNELTQIRSGQTSTVEILCQTQAKKAKFDEDLAREEEHLKETEAAAQSLDQELRNVKDNKDMEESVQGKLRERVKEVTENLIVLREKREKILSRLEVINELEVQMEGLDSGAKALLMKDGAKYPGIIGTVADLIEVDKEHLPLLEAALGDKSGTLVVENHEQAKEALAYVKSQRLGKVALVVADGEHQHDTNTNHAGDPSQPSPMEWVHCKPQYRSLLERLIGKMAVADNLDQAMEWMALRRHAYPIVTRDGDIVHPNGVIVTGAMGTSQPILSRKTELRDLVGERDMVATELERGQNQKSDVERMHQVLEEKLDLIRKSIYEKQIGLLEKNSECDQLRKRINFLKGEGEIVRMEIDQYQNRIAEADQKAGSIEKLLKDLDELHGRLSQTVSEKAERLRQYEGERSRLETEDAALYIEQARLSEKETSLQDRVRAGAVALKESELRLERAQGQLRQAEERGQALSQELAAKRTELEQLEQSREKVRKQLDEAKIERDGCAEELGRMGAHQQDLITALKECDESLQKLRLDETQASMKIENLIDRAQREYNLQVNVEEVTSSETAPVDPEALAKEVEDIRSKMQSMGAVNLLALDRLTELEERGKYLKAQSDDLDGSKKQLEELIQKINKESRELFDKTLASVREDFSAIFRKLFGGGKAEIVMEEAEGLDIFDAGLEIMVKLPSKETTALSLLSGGEKSLTALALVMALFKANPSPFCILDESDAALDEKNVTKYVGLINEFIEETQFIVITHNKRTMAMADALYGITMEQAGVSKVVTVNMNEDGKRLRPARAQQEPVGAGVSSESSAPIGG